MPEKLTRRTKIDTFHYQPTSERMPVAMPSMLRGLVTESTVSNQSL